MFTVLDAPASTPAGCRDGRTPAQRQPSAAACTPADARSRMHRTSRRSYQLCTALLALSLGRTPAPAQTVRPYRPAVDVLDYAFALTLPDTGRALAGEATVRFARTTPTDTLVLDLVGLRVDAVRVARRGGALRAAAFRQDSAAVHVALPGHATGDTLVAVVRYAGTPTDGLIVSRDSAGRWQAFGDNWPDRARHWLPTVDDPSDKATVSWTVNAPRTRTVVANGALVAVQDLPTPRGHAPRRITAWREARPIAPYLMVIAAAPLVRVDLGQTACGRMAREQCVSLTVPQAVYVTPELGHFVPVAFRAAADIVRWDAARIAPFPYEKLAHVESSTRYGGMENASAIFYADDAFRRGTADRRLIAHETAHQWFGDAVTPRAWGHLWLSEGFATYWTALDTQRAVGDSAFRDEMRRMRDRVVEAPESVERPVLDTAETQYAKLNNPNSYQKGAWVLHMLRGLLGDAAFFRGVRAYYAAHRDGTAVTDDLREALEASGGRRLDGFFDQWLRRPGFAELTTSWRYDAAAHRVQLRVAQGPRFAPYRFPLDVDLVDADGRSRRVTVEIPAEREVILVLATPLAAPPRAVRVDPDVQLLATVVDAGGGAVTAR